MSAHPTTVDLDDLQGFLVFRRPTPYWGTFAMLHIDDAATGRRLLRDLLAHIHSAASWARGERDVNVALAVTHAGLAALGVPPTDLASFPVQLREGMAARAELVDDVGSSAPERWDPPFGTGAIHLMLVVTAGSEQSWGRTLAEATQSFDWGGSKVLYQQDFAAFPGGRTTFGYRDGISYPAIAGLPTTPITTPEAPIATGEFLLGHPSETGEVLASPTPTELSHNGTYVGFRKVHTDVAAFRRFLGSHAADAPARERLAAKMMGRWPSGAPLVLSPDHDDPALAADTSRVNDFGYGGDARGMSCPIGAHIRRVNPRDAHLDVLTNPRIHRLLRFGAVYGEPLPDGVDVDDGADRGIYLLFATARPNTFEFIKREWIAQGGFNGLGDEMDPIAGPHTGGDDDTFTIPASPMRRRVGPFERFTATRGGEYALLPSMTALRWLSG